VSIGWQPIRTAPQGRTILVRAPDGRPFREPKGRYPIYFAVVRWDQGWFSGTDLVEINDFAEWHEIPK
jgi:hypothetical protein